jgi:ubiquinone/menaquinone biosynthesis C-methylase UbiE
MREWKTKEQTMRHYELQAEIYNVQYMDEQKAKIEEILKFMKLEQRDCVLDLGCGTGFLFNHISEKVELLLGLDISQKALKMAKRRIKYLRNVHLVRADADNMPFPNNIFDKVFAITVLQNILEPKKTIEEIKRKSKPHSMFAVTGLKKKFTQKNFVSLLESAKLKIISLNTSQQLKGYIAICTKR